VSRVLLILFLLAPPLLAKGPTRLGTLIRWYLTEKSPSRQWDILEKIRQLCDDDAIKVAEAIRKGEHFKYEELPEFGTGGTVPVFRLDRMRIQPLAGAAGDFADLFLPDGYDARRNYPLVIDLGGNLPPVPEAALLVRMRLGAHPKAATHAQAAEGLVLSVLARTCEIAHVDAGRVFLRAQGEVATAMAWYIALHNPDRFAGMYSAQGYWPGGLRLWKNSLLFSILAIESRKGDRALRAFMVADPRLLQVHDLLKAPENPREDSTLLPAVDAWFTTCKRRSAPSRLEIVADRVVATRAFWIQVVPKQRSRRHEILARIWEHDVLARPATLSASIAMHDRNLIRVNCDRVRAFHIYIDPTRHDVDAPIRVSINGGVPEAKLIDLKISDLLEDYRERRDPELLYACRLSYSVR
jgi:hypothetical protein